MFKYFFGNKPKIFLHGHRPYFIYYIFVAMWGKIVFSKDDADAIFVLNFYVHTYVYVMYDVRTYYVVL